MTFWFGVAVGAVACVILLGIISTLGLSLSGDTGWWTPPRDRNGR